MLKSQHVVKFDSICFLKGLVHFLGLPLTAIFIFINISTNLNDFVLNQISMKSFFKAKVKCNAECSIIVQEWQHIHMF